MKITEIGKIKIMRLPAKNHSGGSDRRGPLIEVYPRGEVEVSEYSRRRIIDTLQGVILLLGYPIQHVRKGETGEQMECWINLETRERYVWVNHKYWSQAQVDAFHELMLTMAKLHEWEWEVINPNANGS